jgi:hypothetical protein
VFTVGADLRAARLGGQALRQGKSSPEIALAPSALINFAAFRIGDAQRCFDGNCPISLGIELQQHGAMADLSTDPATRLDKSLAAVATFTRIGEQFSACGRQRRPVPPAIESIE